MTPSCGARSDGGWRLSKLGVLHKYRFTVAFENSEHLGYTTEKVFDAFQADTVPIYWGNPAAAIDVDPRAMISFYEHGSLAKLVDHVLEVDADPDLYEQYRRHNPFRTGGVDEALARTEVQVRAFLAGWWRLPSVSRGPRTTGGAPSTPSRPPPAWR